MITKGPAQNLRDKARIVRKGGGFKLKAFSQLLLLLLTFLEK